MSDSVLLIGEASIPQEDKEVAWEQAKDLMTIRPDIGWLMGRFVQATVPNLNGHIFALDQLQDRHSMVVNTPLNMLHKSRYVVGSFVGTEMMYPTGVGADDASVEAPFVEALASFYRAIFSDEWEDVKKAHSEGLLAFSMECVPEQLECNECKLVAAYDGVRSRTYCDHMNVSGNGKWLLNPSFVGGAVILPPAKPGWKGADVKQLASYTSKNEEEMDSIMSALKETLPHLDEKVCEEMALVAVYNKAGKEAADVNEFFEAKDVVVLSLVAADTDERVVLLKGELGWDAEALETLVEGLAALFDKFDESDAEKFVSFLQDVLGGVGVEGDMIVPEMEGLVAVAFEGSLNDQTFTAEFA